ncbi:P-II family nitrogen regulator [Rhizobium laguerreae]
MKKIEAIFPPSRVGDVREALLDLSLLEFVLSDVTDFAPRNRRVTRYRGVEHVADDKSAVRLEIVTRDTQTEIVAEAILTALIGYGADTRILVSDVYEILTC